ncbi:MAG: hypothetical protein LC753_11145 [Acidobacteria bacterium]|nr:hypothetical protein [Acidobacteriota bacterium]MCA1650800.1 hypothetical protein [Acidobacteriota bacterium]
MVADLLLVAAALCIGAAVYLFVGAAWMLLYSGLVLLMLAWTLVRTSADGDEASGGVAERR